MQIWDSRNDRPVLITNGNSTTTTTASATPDAPTRSRNRSARRRKSAEPCIHVDRSPVREPNCKPATRTSMTTRSTPKRISSTVAGFVIFQFKTSTTTPSPIPATNAAVRLTMAPINPAMSARTSRSGLSTCVRTLVWPGAFKTAANADSAPAKVQATVEVRRTHTPDRRAESAFSDMARMARPHGENLMNAATDSATIGATMSVSTSPGVNVKLLTVKLRWIGTGNGRDRFLGRTNGSAVKRNSTCDSPIVATITRTRGRSKIRRNTSSHTAPVAAAAPNAITRATQ